ncbi:MAG: DUF4437 domain-containing protein [Alphaproteobacteria bacterium]|nr:DUF4437 domain-containing protein [Alphaproteobacteria bacterium]
MARPHLDFIQPQVLPWTRGLYGGGRPEVEVKTLSIDPEGKDSSLVLRYAAGYARREHEHLAADEEVFVLEGAFELNGTLYERGAYAHFPVGFERRSFSAPAGAVVLTFFSAEPRAFAGAPTNPCDERRLIRHIDTRRGGWEDNKYFPGRVLFLRNDPVTGDMTYLQTTRPNDGSGKVERHTTVQEMYTLAGELSGPYGIYYAGAYFWRPAGIKHGPFGTQTGCNFFMRSVGGPLLYEYFPVEKPFRWVPEHKPILPPGHERYAGPWRPSTNY